MDTVGRHRRGVGQTTTSRLGRRASSAASSVLVGILVVGIAAIAILVTLVPAIGRADTLTVLSGSMVPALPVGSVVVDRRTAPSSLRVGDIVTYSTTDEVTGAPILITHRVVKIHQGATGRTFITKGDANNSVDRRPVGADQIRGKVWYHVPYVGRARDFLRNSGGLLMIGAAVVLIAGLLTLRRILHDDDDGTSDDGDGTSGDGDGTSGDGGSSGDGADLQGSRTDKDVPEPAAMVGTPTVIGAEPRDTQVVG